MWIQAWQDPAKQWLQMHYFITEGDINMVISEWPDEWRIPTINQEVPERTVEEEAEQRAMQPPKIQVPKRPRTSQCKTTHKYEEPKNIGTQKRNKENTQLTR
jgi:hypothetical protein